jgi:hypothetical protein
MGQRRHQRGVAIWALQGQPFLCDTSQPSEITSGTNRYWTDTCSTREQPTC